MAIFGFWRSSQVEKDKILPKEFKAEVLSDSIPTAYGSSLLVQRDGSVERLKIYLPWYPEFITGDVVLVKVKNNDKFIKAEAVFLEHKKVNFFIGSLLNIKRQFLKSISEVLSEPNASFTAGTIIGGSSGLPQDLKESFRVAGILHVLAASGYNFTLLIMFIAFCLRPFSLKKQILTCLLVIPAFVVIAGGAPSVLRAALMSGLGGVAIE